MSTTAPIIAGIDPGLYGAIAWLDAARLELVDVASLPVVQEAQRRKLIDVRALGALLQRYPVRLWVVEHVHALPRDGRTAAFSFGRVVGSIETALVLHGCRFVRTAPQTWRKWAGIPARAPKTWSTAAAYRLCPSAYGRLATSDQAEALLLALHAAEAQHPTPME